MHPLLKIQILGVIFSALAAVELASKEGLGSALNKRVDTFETLAEQQNRDPDRKWCKIYQERRRLTYDGVDHDLWAPIDGYKGLATCQAECPQQNDTSKIHSVACGWLTGNEWTWSDEPDQEGRGAIQSAVAPCMCDDPALIALSKMFIDALPIIASIACTVFVGAFTGLVDVFINTVIDTLEEAVNVVQKLGPLNDGHTNIINGALIFDSTYTTLEKGRSAFGKWLASNVCPRAISDEDQNKIFDAINQVNSVIVDVATLPTGGEALAAFRLASGGFKWSRFDPPLDELLPSTKHDPNVDPPTIEPKPDREPPTPTDKARPSDPSESEHVSATSDKHSTHSHEKSSSGTSASVTEDSSITTETKATTTQASSTSACVRNHKRLNDQSSHQDDCDGPTVTEWIIKTSIPVISGVSTAICHGKYYPQACAHYASAVANLGSGAITCGDNARNKTTAPPAAATQWSSQHEDPTWYSYTRHYDFKSGSPVGSMKDIAPECQAVPWPLRTFVTGNKTSSAGRKEGAHVRWIPKLEFEQVFIATDTYCVNFDGGKGNAQRSEVLTQLGSTIPPNSAQIPLNTNFIDVGGAKTSVKTKSGSDGTTTVTTFYDRAKFTRAAMSVSFDWSGMEEPSDENDYLLKANPCWPSAIVPQDPGYVLLTDDSWYKTNSAGKKAAPTVTAYAQKPDQEVLKAAGSAQGDNMSSALGMASALMSMVLPHAAKAKRQVDIRRWVDYHYQPDNENADSALSSVDRSTTPQITEAIPTLVTSVVKPQVAQPAGQRPFVEADMPMITAFPRV